jgi:hypothetical protein
VAPEADSVYDLTLLDFAQQNQSLEQVTVEQEVEEDATIEEIESIKERRFPWPIDILLYPTSKAGLSTIVVIMLIKLATDFVAIFLSICICGGILGLLLRITLVWSYMYWYFFECVHDSAEGGLRAPETIGCMTGVGDMFWQFFRLFCAYALFYGPVTFYRGYTFLYRIETDSVIFWSLLAYGSIFFPMGVLALAMFGSVNGLNPVLIVRSILSTFMQYCGLIILFFCLGVLFVVTLSMMVRILPKLGLRSYMFLFYISFSILSLYVLLIAGHLLGRFYWRYEDKLRWGF